MENDIIQTTTKTPEQKGVRIGAFIGLVFGLVFSFWTIFGILEHGSSIILWVIGVFFIILGGLIIAAIGGLIGAILGKFWKYKIIKYLFIGFILVAAAAIVGTLLGMKK